MPRPGWQDYLRYNRITRTALLLIALFVLIYQFTPHELTKQTQSISDYLGDMVTGSNGEHPRFFKDAITMLLNNSPRGIPNLKLSEGEMKAPSYWYIDVPGEPFTIDFLQKYTEISQAQLTELSSKHRSVKSNITEFTYPEGVFKGKGIVMVGGGDFLGTALTSILTLRDTGSKLPLELILTSFDEYQADVCEVMLPSLNAKCIILEEVLGSDLFEGLNLKKYELKVLGLFVSTFEHALLMDADNLAVKSPDYILNSSLFKKYGYIIWMDFWRQTISPYFYQIAGINIGEPVRKDGIYPDRDFSSRGESQLADLEGAIPDSTCEAGQLAINKRTHFKPLLMTVYYNLLGFKFYYQLLGQGAVGIGDKDTFIAGLTVFGIEPYFVKQRPLLLGYNYGENEAEWQDTTMVQYDPVQDFEYYSAAKEYMISKKIDPRINIFLNNDFTNNLRDEMQKALSGKHTLPQVQFLHMHNPKFNAYSNHIKGDYSIDSHPRRQFGNREKISGIIDKDYELRFLAISEWLACQSTIIPDNWKVVDRSEYCTAIKEHVAWLKKTSDTPSLGTVNFKFNF
ncbi:hypothetical protein WICPIJ_003047 [Wickerhamomyces pijperi]|uniref:Glycosyltransferase family 71 protein n=1 Tax=Wickerhamomyces pijperi TaxID=599730 RepID=A0A9P8QAC1_WICPI|nr:hypothetical protein WICPIJ_003047 [Wickerhamomyces pijperi]